MYTGYTHLSFSFLVCLLGLELRLRERHGGGLPLLLVRGVQDVRCACDPVEQRRSRLHIHGRGDH